MLNIRADIQLFVHSNTDMNIHVIPVGRECQLPRNVFVYNVCLGEKEAFPVFGKVGGVGWGGSIQTAEQGREEEEEEEGSVFAAGAIG